MEKILISLEDLHPALLEGSLPQYRVETVAGRRALAEAIVSEYALRCLIMQRRNPTENGCDRFLSSLRRHFPMLPVAVISPPQASGVPETVARIFDVPDPTVLLPEVIRFVESTEPVNRRRFPRFSWPIEGSYTGDGTTWIHCPVRSISAGGAFLESHDPVPPLGLRGTVRIRFRNGDLTAEFETMTARPEREPTGFGIRFISLSPEAEGVIARIVQDALLSELLDQSEASEIPVLDEEILGVEGFDGIEAR